MSSRGLNSSGYSSKGLSNSSFNNEQFGSVRQSAYHAPSGGATDDSTNAGIGEEQSSGNQQAMEVQDDPNILSDSAEFQDQAASTSAPSTLGGTAFSQGNSFYGGQMKAYRRVMPDPEAGETDGKVRIGSNVKMLPAGCVQISAEGTTYYYKAGYFYNPFSVNGVWSYAVVRPPVGMTVFELPEGCTVRAIGRSELSDHQRDLLPADLR